MKISALFVMNYYTIGRAVVGRNGTVRLDLCGSTRSLLSFRLFRNIEFNIFNSLILRFMI